MDHAPEKDSPAWRRHRWRDVPWAQDQPPYYYCQHCRRSCAEEDATTATATRPGIVLTIHSESAAAVKRARALRSHGFDVINANSVERALTLAAHTDFDIIVIAGTPTKTAIPTLCRDLRAAAGSRHIPIVLVTSHLDDVTDAADVCMLTGALGELTSLLRTLIRRRDPGR
jgi:methylmalonyl-CoA mutase cobalamin-binding subunit